MALLPLLAPELTRAFGSGEPPRHRVHVLRLHLTLCNDLQPLNLGGSQITNL
jgi:hypothetical protein